MFKRILLPFILALFAGLLPILFDAKTAAAAVPDGFEDKIVTSLDAPTALAFTPDERMLVTSKSGQLRVYKDGALLETPALNLSSEVCSNSERGLLGVAVDPDFASNNYVYVYYTYKKHGVCETNTSRSPVNRVSRFVMSGDTLDPASEEVLVDNIPSPNGNHNAGDVKFGKDGYLYISVGDGGCDYAEKTRCQYENNASRDRHILLGKVLRITRDGEIPSDNPYTGPDSARCNETGRTTPGDNCQETFARGFRNPFRMAFDPDATGTSFRINDVGGQKWEEVDDGKAGADYGWNVREGHCKAGSTTNCDAPPAGMTNPIHDYAHSTGCGSITGGAFVPNSASWPTSYNDAYLFGDYVCGKIFKLTPKDGGGFSRSQFATGLGQGGPIAMAFGPYETGEVLYYTTFAGGGEVRRIAYADGNLAPAADIETTGPNYGPAPLTVSFDGSGSSDPDGDTSLTYEWDFTNDGTVDATGATVTHTYDTAGVYTATLRVRDSLGAVSAPDEIKVYPGDAPPEPTISSPTPEKLFVVEEDINLSGSATDDEDGTDNPPELRWEVIRHHGGDHTHPYFSGTGTDLTFEAPAPEDLASTGPGNHLEIRLTATDSQGLSKTVSQQLDPKRVDVSFTTEPTGFKLIVNGGTFRAPRTFVSWEGYKLNVYAPRQEDKSDRLWVFRSWSDGGASKHTITTLTDPTTYTATFKRRR